jgi:hypothetical protein
MTAAKPVKAVIVKLTRGDPPRSVFVVGAKVGEVDFSTRPVRRFWEVVGNGTATFS